MYTSKEGGFAHTTSRSRYASATLPPYTLCCCHILLCYHQAPLCDRQFDASLLQNEMRKLGLCGATESWEQIVCEGLCTMDPDICQWVRHQIGIGDKPRKIPMRLADALRALLPDHAHLLAEHHDAGVDSYMHWLLAGDLVRRAQTM